MPLYPDKLASAATEVAQDPIVLQGAEYGTAEVMAVFGIAIPEIAFLVGVSAAGLTILEEAEDIIEDPFQDPFEDLEDPRVSIQKAKEKKEKAKKPATTSNVQLPPGWRSQERQEGESLLRQRRGTIYTPYIPKPPEGFIERILDERWQKAQNEPDPQQRTVPNDDCGLYKDRISWCF